MKNMTNNYLTHLNNEISRVHSTPQNVKALPNDKQEQFKKLCDLQQNDNTEYIKEIARMKAH